MVCEELLIFLGYVVFHIEQYGEVLGEQALFFFSAMLRYWELILKTVRATMENKVFFTSFLQFPLPLMRSIIIYQGYLIH